MASSVSSECNVSRASAAQPGSNSNYGALNSIPVWDLCTSNRYIPVVVDLVSAAQPVAASMELEQFERQPWTISTSERQFAVKQYTHSRKLPLPTTLDCCIEGSYFTCQYIGHGKSKVAYVMHTLEIHEYSGKVLKLAASDDIEPEVIMELQSTGLYPQLYAWSCCVEYNAVGQPISEWKAWVVDYALPLDQFLNRPNLPAEASSVCIVGAVRCMLHAAQHSHYMSDNAWFNFGIVRGEVVILDVGSRPIHSVTMSKSAFNATVMKKIWPKARLLVSASDMTPCQNAWRQSLCMTSAMEAFDKLWDRIDRSDVVAHCSAVQSAQMAHGLCYDVVANAPHPMCPHAASLLDSVSEESLDWLQDNFLWGSVSKYSLSVDGTIAFNDNNEVSSPLLKLEILIRITHDRRATVCADAHVNVLSEDDLDLLLKAWKKDYWLWMHPSTIKTSWSDSRNEWKQRCRTTFRSFSLISLTR